MTSLVRRHPNARRDLVNIFVHLGRTSIPTSRRFLLATDATFTRLAALPGLGVRYDPDDPRFAELRWFPVSRFRNYLIFYRPIEGGIEVLRVLHGARDIAGILSAEVGDGEDEDAEVDELDPP